MSECFVSQADFYRYGFDREIVAAAWTGEERRIAEKDRRANLHDRRWEAQRGRRYRPGDRRYRRIVVTAAPDTARTEE